MAAIAGQVRHIVFLSAISVHDGAPPEANGVWGLLEQAIEQSGATWTFLRAGGFAANTLAWADQIRSGGVVRWAYGKAARSLIHERDIADVAVRALTNGTHAGGKYVLTGPEAVTQAEQARIIGEVTGLPVRWEEAAPEAIREQLAAITGDYAFADQAVAYWASLIAQPEPVTHAVEEITGAPARTFRDWARDHASDFRPRSPAEVDQPAHLVAPPEGSWRSAETPSPGRAAGGARGAGQAAPPGFAASRRSWTTAAGKPQATRPGASRSTARTRWRSWASQRRSTRTD